MSVFGPDESGSVINFDTQNDIEDIYSDGTVQAPGISSRLELQFPSYKKSAHVSINTLLIVTAQNLTIAATYMKVALPEMYTHS